MRRRDVLRAGAAVALAGVVGCTGPSAEPTFTEGFEDGLGDWESDAAIGPEVAIEPNRAYEITATGQLWSESESFNTIRNAVMRLTSSTTSRSPSRSGGFDAASPLPGGGRGGHARSGR